MPTHLPFGPLARRLERLGELAAVLSPAQRQAYYRARRAGRWSADMVDELAARVLGTHPADIYGLEWYGTAA